MRDTSRYGRFYWCAKVTKDLAKRGEIYVMADRVRVSEGALHFVQDPRSEGESERVNLLVPARKWIAVYAASLFDGSAVAVEHWAEEIAEEGEDGDAEEEPEPARSGVGRAKASSRAKPKRVSKAARWFVLDRDGGTCKMCGRSAKDGVPLEVDHIDPDAFGGDSSVENLQVLCRDCNRGKGPKRQSTSL